MLLMMRNSVMYWSCVSGRLLLSSDSILLLSSATCGMMVNLDYVCFELYVGRVWYFLYHVVFILRVSK